MLRPVKNILNYKILATDGEIGPPPPGSAVWPRSARRW